MLGIAFCWIIFGLVTVEKGIVDTLLGSVLVPWLVKVGWNKALRLLYWRQTSSNSLCLWWSKWKKRGRGLIWYPGAILSGKVPGGHLTSRLDLSGLTSLSPPSSVPLHDNISGLCPLFCSRGEMRERWVSAARVSLLSVIRAPLSSQQEDWDWEWHGQSFINIFQ